MKKHQFLYQNRDSYFAQAPDGVEELLMEELEALGGDRIEKRFRGVQFSASPQALYHIVYNTRLTTRILAPLAMVGSRDRDQLYIESKKIPWETLFTVKDTFGIFATGANNQNLRNSKFAALCLKDAIADRFRQIRGLRPSVNKTEPDLWLNLHIEGTRATINLDLSGGSMHKRGYRQRSVEAPLQETLAAAMVSASGWNGEKPLYDPMCGSGTLLCEALIRAAHIPAGYLRKNFGFRFLPDFSKSVWNDVKSASDHAITKIPNDLIGGSDTDPMAVMAAHVNRRMLPEGDKIRVDRMDFRDHPGVTDGTIVCNPPYGLRLDEKDLAGLYKAFGDYLKQRCKGTEAYLFFGNRDMLKHIGLKPEWKKPIRNAGLDARIAKFVLY